MRLLLILLLFAAPAQAQTGQRTITIPGGVTWVPPARIDPCTGQSVAATPPPEYLVSWKVGGSTACIDRRPADGSWHREITTIGPAAGMTEWHYCKSADGKYRARWIVTTPRAIKDIGLLKDAFLAGWPNLSAEARATLAAKYAYLVLPLDAPELAAVWCPVWPQITAGTPVVSPTPSAWIVAKNGLNTTRPTYPVIAGLRSKTPNGVAAVGTDCDTAAAILEPVVAGSTVMLTWGYPVPRGAAPAGSVTLCVRR